MKDEENNLDSTQKIPRLKEPAKKLIPIVCSWCKKIYKLSEWQVDLEKKIGVSHGICDECLKKFEMENKKNE